MQTHWEWQENHPGMAIRDALVMGATASRSDHAQF
jgi:hypothetical protein